MLNAGKRSVLGVDVDVVDYDGAVDEIIRAAHDGRTFAATALAVHGVMVGSSDEEYRYRLNQLDLVAPDGQPVRWALRVLYGVRLPDRVYGPTLMLKLCEQCEHDGLAIFLYGATPETLERLSFMLSARFPKLKIAGTEASKFRHTTAEEMRSIARRVNDSGANLCFVGLGCPRQEVFVFEYRSLLSIPAVAVGAAFDYHAGNLREPGEWIQRHGLQWLHRLFQDPRRLWRRYLILNPLYLLEVGLQLLHLRQLGPGEAPPSDIRYG